MQTHSEEYRRAVLELLQRGKINKETARSLLSPRKDDRAPIAIVGLACRMPQSKGVEGFWKNLVEGRDLLTEIPASRKTDADAHYEGVPDSAFVGGKRYWTMAYLDEVDRFDAELFGIAPGEAEVMDPAHRLFLETATEAMDDAALAPRMRGANTGVFVGNPGTFFTEGLEDFNASAVTGNVPEFLASRVAFVHDFRGPAMGVQSTCSSSLVAVHLAVRALREGTCDHAVAGGAVVYSYPGNIPTNPMTLSGIVSASHRSRPFAEGADGLGRGEGVIAFVLKRLDDAIEHGDHVVAVVRGSAVNNDGRCAGLSAPNPAAHARLLQQCWDDAGVDATTIDYIETHGTGTALGDPIEVAGITRAFAKHSKRRQFVGIGSVKGNVGHLVDGAAGATGLLKLALSLKHKTIPASLHFDKPNSRIDFFESAVYVADETRAWKKNGSGPRRGGVSSFGFNGTNCHLVVEEAPPLASRPACTRSFPVVFSGRDEEELIHVLQSYRALLERSPQLELRDLAFTLAEGRVHRQCRAGFFVSSLTELRECLGRGLPTLTDPRLEAFVGGGRLDFASLFVAAGARRIPLPAAPLRSKRHWPASTRHRLMQPFAHDGKSTSMAAVDVAEGIREIWRQVLGESLGGGSFFEEGGNSLLATMVTSRIKGRLGIEVPLTDVFEAEDLDALIARVEERRPLPSGDDDAITPIPREGLLPVSLTQQRLWVLEQMAPGTSQYNIPAAVEITGRLDVTAMMASLQDVMARHEVLRTCIVDVDGSPAAQLVDVPEAMLTTQRLTPHRGEDMDSALRRRLQEEAERPFVLSEGPLLRATLFAVEEDRHVLCLVIHHIVADGWSLRLLVDEVRERYAAYHRGDEALVAPLPYQYADFAAWQRSRSDAGHFDAEFEYWKSKLAGAPTTIPLPTDHPRRAAHQGCGTTHSFRIPPETSAALQGYIRGAGATLFTVGLSAFASLLQRYTGQGDLLIGSPIANRNRLDTEELIGFFSNLAVLRVQPGPELTFRELVSTVRRVVAEASDHQDLPFEELVARLQPERDLSRQPLCQVNFATEEVVLADHHDDEMGLSFRALELETQTSKFDLVFTLVEHPDGGVVVQMEYDTTLFEAETIAAMGRHYVNLLREGLAQGATPLGKLPLLDTAERRRLVVEWNDTATDFADKTLLHQWFEARAEKRPDLIALTQDGHAATTYGELDARANQIATWLLARGVRAEDKVVVCMERTPDLVAALLGVLKAGGCYVPIDASWPAERLEHVLRSTGAHVCISEETRREEIAAMDLPTLTDVLLMDIDAPTMAPAARREWGRSAIRGASSTAPKVTIAPSQLAYIIYTSGSTGLPKGVMVEHRQTANLIDWANEEFGIAEGDSLLWVTSVCFDLSVYDLFGMLAGGARVHIATDVEMRDPASIAGLLHRESITVWNSAPVLLREVEPHLRGTTLRICLLGGDFIPVRLPAAMRRHRADLDIRSLGGATETTVNSCMYTIDGVDPEWSTIPYGKPMPNARYYCLDEHLEPVPIGVVGELYVAGSCIARGYHADETRTRERFLRDPHTTRADDRMYRTGDLVRVHRSGDFEILGRADSQVKINGYRIELGEVSAAATECDLVDCAIADVVETDEGARQLALYWVAAPEGEFSAAGALDIWTDVFDDTYVASPDASEDASADYRGWRSSLTGEDIPTAEMDAWRSERVARIHGRGAKRVVELGCGLGLLASQVAPRCDTFVATDISREAVRRVRSLLRDHPAAHVHHQGAHELSGIDVGEQELFILSSVIQYFPSSEYLRGVLAGLAREMKDGAAIYIADVRHVDWMPNFHRAVLAKRQGVSPEAVSTAEVGAAVLRDRELCVSPSFFEEFAASLDRPMDVQVCLLQADDANEMTRFRYDVLLTMGDSPDEKAVAEAESIDAALALATPSIVRDVPNGHLLDAPTAPTAGAIASAAAKAGYDVRTRPSESAGHFDALFVPKGATPAPFGLSPCPRRGDSPLTNVPSRAADMERQRAEVRDHIARRLPRYMVPKHVLRLETLPLTSNGKLDRARLPRPAIRERGVAIARPMSDNEALVARVWSELLYVDSVGPDDDFFLLGGDSILAIQAVSRLRTQGLDTTSAAIFQHRTVAGVARRVTVATSRSHERGEGEALLSPIQQWWLSEDPPDASHYNQSALLSLASSIDVPRMTQAVEHVLAAHDAFRLRFERKPDGRWNQRYVTGNTHTVGVHRSVQSADELTDLCDGLQRALNIHDGPTVRAFGVDAPIGKRLFIAAHHLVIDAVSWRILLEDIQVVYAQLSSGAEPMLAAPTAPFGEWTRALESAGPAVESEIEYWRCQRPTGAPFPTDRPRRPCAEATSELVTVVLEPLATRELLRNVPRRTGASVDALLLSAFLEASRALHGARELYVTMDGHGRESMVDCDVVRTVGWFTSNYPVLFCAGDKSSADLVRSVHETLEAVPNNGLGYGILRYLHASKPLAEHPEPQIIFNNLGQFDQVRTHDYFRIADEADGAWLSERQLRHFDLAIDAHVRQGRLRVSFGFSTELYDTETIQSLAHAFRQNLLYFAKSDKRPRQLQGAL